METNSIVDFERRDGISDGLTDLLREGAQTLIARAVEAELEGFLAQFVASRTAAGHAAVVRGRPSSGAPVTFRSALVPPYVRKAKSLEAALPWLYLKGVSSGEMGAALQALLGADAKGLSASTVSRLKRVWAKEYSDWRTQPLDKEPWVYIWADGIYSGLRGAEDKLCALVIIGVNARGEKHFLAIHCRQSNACIR